MKYKLDQEGVRKDDEEKFVGKSLKVNDIYKSRRTKKELYEVKDDTDESFLCKEEDIVSAGEYLAAILDAELIDEDEN